MSPPAWAERFRPHSVPVCVFAIVVMAALLVPPLVLGEMTGRTYALAAAVILLAIASAFPYAILVGIVTLPLPYAGLGSYTSPRVVPAADESLSLEGALRHVVAGIAYVLAAATVGGLGIGIDFAVSSSASWGPEALQPPFLVLGGIVVGGIFVGLQLWRYDGSVHPLTRRTILGTAVLGALLALSPVVALWLFGSGAI